MQKQKSLTTHLKRLSTNIDTHRKNIESNIQIIPHINELKANFGEVESIIKGQSGSIDGIKTFSKESTTETSKNLQSKRAFVGIFEKYRQEIRVYVEMAAEHFVVSYKDNSTVAWQKLGKDLDKAMITLQEQSLTIEQMFDSIQRLSTCKENILTQLLKQAIYQKNILWRDLNAPYDDYIHGEVKSIINQIKSYEQKLGYIPSRLKFEVPKLGGGEGKSDLVELLKVHLGDFAELVEGLKNYSKLAGQEQVIEDISKNQHIVKGLRERIEKLTVSYQSLMQRYRNLQISKGKLSPSQQKSLTQRVEQLQSTITRKDNQILQLRQIHTKSQTTIQSLRDKTKQLQEELSKFQKYQMPKIKELENNQRSILDQFMKVRRDLETYSNIVTTEREEKLRLVDDIRDERKRVEELAFILGRERRRIKELKEEIIRKEQIVMELVDEKLPNQLVGKYSQGVVGK